MIKRGKFITVKNRRIWIYEPLCEITEKSKQEEIVQVLRFSKTEWGMK